MSEDPQPDPHGSDAPEITEAPVGDQLAARGPLLKRRKLLAAVGGIAAAGGVAGGLTREDSGSGFVSGGAAQLQQAYHVAGGLYIGPESANSTVSPEAGRFYIASDSNKEFYGDGSSWQWQGSNVPTLTTDELVNIADHVVGSVSEIEALVDNNEIGEGDHIAIGGGTYALSKALSASVSDVWVSGLGDTVLTFPDGTTPDYDLIEAADGWLIEGVEFDGNAGNTSIPSVHTDGAGVEFVAGHNQTVRDCTFQNLHFRAIHSYVSDNVSLGSIEVTGWSKSGNEPAVDADHDADGWTIGSECHFHDGPYRAVVADGSKKTSKHHHISGIFENIADTAIGLSGRGADGSVVADIRVFDCDGVIGGSAHGVEITDPFVLGTPQLNMDRGWTLNGGRITDWDALPAIKLSGQGATVDGARLQGGSLGGFESNGQIRVDAPDCAVDATFDNVSRHPVFLTANADDATIESEVVQASGSTTLSAAASAGDTTLDLAAHAFEVGDRISIGSQNTFVSAILDDAANGQANTVELVDALDSDHASGTSVSTNIIAWGFYVSSGAADVNFFGDVQPNGISDNGTRTRYEGVIGGGVLGGVDLGSVTGQHEGDEAVSNGTSSTDQLKARWTGSAWQPSDGSATI